MVSFKKSTLSEGISLFSSNASTVSVYARFKDKQGQDVRKVVKKIFEVETR